MGPHGQHGFDSRQAPSAGESVVGNGAQGISRVAPCEIQRLQIPLDMSRGAPMLLVNFFP